MKIVIIIICVPALFSEAIVVRSIMPRTTITALVDKIKGLLNDIK